MLLSAVVDSNLDLRVVYGRSRVVDEAVGERVVHHKGEGVFSSSQPFDLFNELLELDVVSRISLSKGVDFLHLVDDLREHSFDRSVDTSEGAWLKLKVDFGD